MNTKLIKELTNSLDLEFRNLNQILLNASSSKKTELLNQIAYHIIASGGKRIRPLLTITTAKLFQADDVAMHKVLRLASAIEFIHAATLLHDDVVDNSISRRNNKTANYIWGNKPSILVGDFLFSQSFKQMVETENLKVLEILANASAKIAEAEVWQLDIVGKLDLKYAEYIDLVSAKTANLFAAACECAAILANATSKQIDASRDFGLNLGIIFQIQDDICDYFGEPELLGKKTGNDFFENKITLPIILLLQEASKEDLADIKTILNKQDKTMDCLSKLMSYFKQHSIEEKSYDNLNDFITEGAANLEYMPESQFKDTLFNLLQSYRKLI
jgi:octaprenyl-diphosphate synthase